MRHVALTDSSPPWHAHMLPTKATGTVPCWVFVALLAPRTSGPPRDPFCTSPARAPRTLPTRGHLLVTGSGGFT